MTPNRPARTDVSTGRRIVYHLGQVLVVVGILLFLSVFLTFFGTFGTLLQAPFPGGDPQGGPVQVFGGLFSSFIRAPIGIVVIWIGMALMAVGRRGVAGSGLTLDPQGTRTDEEPWNRAQGGMLEDTLDASPTLKNALTGQPTVVKVRCRACGALNDETDRYCGQCGKPL